MDIMKLREYDFNFYAEDTIISYSGGNNTQGSSLLLLNNFGTKVFNKCTIRTDRLATTIDLNTQATNGAVTFIDCEFENVTITPRVGDKILYTKPNSNCASYVDNATALTALGEGYYYKDTTSGKFEVTIA